MFTHWGSWSPPALRKTQEDKLSHTKNRDFTDKNNIRYIAFTLQLECFEFQWGFFLL